METTLKNVRASFLNVFQAKADLNGNMKFSGDFIFEPRSEAHTTLQEAIRKVAQEQWGPKAPDVLKALTNGGRICLKDPSKPNSNGTILSEKHEAYEGMRYVTASHTKRPGVFDRDLSTLVEADGRPYSGCYVNVLLDVKAMDHQEYGRRVYAKLMGIQFVKDGDSFAGGRVAKANDFEALADQGEDSPFEDEAVADLA